MDILNKLGDTIAVKGREVADKAKETAEIVSLKSQIATCEEVLKKNYLEIGKKYFEQYGDMPEESFEKQCTAIQNAQNGIRELHKRIDELKGL